NLLRVRDSSFADALALIEDQRLNEQVAFSGFTLDVVNGVPVFHIGVEAKNGHGVLLLRSGFFVMVTLAGQKLTDVFAGKVRLPFSSPVKPLTLLEPPITFECLAYGSRALYTGLIMDNYFVRYIPLLIQFIVAAALAGVMVLLSHLLGKHKWTPAKNSPYECGIVPTGD